MRHKIRQDLREQKDEPKRFRNAKKMSRRIQGYILTAEYWFVAFKFPITILIYMTHGFWHAVAFWGVSQVYSLAANIRGLGIHVELYLEWLMNERIDPNERN